MAFAVIRKKLPYLELEGGHLEFEGMNELRVAYCDLTPISPLTDIGLNQDLLLANRNSNLRSPKMGIVCVTDRL